MEFCMNKLEIANFINILLEPLQLINFHGFKL